MRDWDLGPQLRVAGQLLLGICGLGLGGARIWVFVQTGKWACLAWGVGEVCAGVWFLRRGIAAARPRRIVGRRSGVRPLSNDR